MVLNQDEGLSSLVPSNLTVDQQPQLQGQPPTAQESDSAHTSTASAAPATTNTSLSHKSATDTTISVSSLPSTAGTSSETTTAAAGRGSGRVPSRGVVTRRMRRQAAAELAEETGRKERGGSVSVAPGAAVEVVVDRLEPMETEQVCHVFSTTLYILRECMHCWLTAHSCIVGSLRSCTHCRVVGWVQNDAH